MSSAQQDRTAISGLRIRVPDRLEECAGMYKTGLINAAKVNTF